MRDLNTGQQELSYGGNPLALLLLKKSILFSLESDNYIFIVRPHPTQNHYEIWGSVMGKPCAMLGPLMFYVGAKTTHQVATA